MLSKNERRIFVFLFLAPLFLYLLAYLGPQTSTENDGLGFVILAAIPFWLFAGLQLVKDFITRMFNGNEKNNETEETELSTLETLKQSKAIRFALLLVIVILVIVVVPLYINFLRM